ncbi:MAG: hypothetical protein WA432_04640 [Candidatus Babeliaceae bacterium]
MNFLIIFFLSLTFFSQSLFCTDSSDKDYLFMIDRVIEVFAHKNGVLFFELPHKEDNEEGDKDKNKDKDASGLTVIDSFKNKIRSLTSEKIKLNNVVDQPNPLSNASLSLISFLGGVPLLVTRENPATVYCFNKFDTPEKFEMKSVQFSDTKEKPAAIVGLGSNIIDHAEVNNSYIFAAVKNKEGNFGQEGSGIARALLVVDGNNNNQEDGPPIHLEVKGIEPIALDSDCIACEGPVEKIHNQNPENPVVFLWSKVCQCLYMGCSITTGAEQNNGGYALSLCSYPQFRMKRIVPSYALGENNIIGTRGIGMQVSVHKMQMLLASTHLLYLVIVGGVGEPDTTQQTVYALPIVSDPSSVNCGMIARKNSMVADVYNNELPHNWYNRYFSEPVMNVHDMYTPDDRIIRVGGGPLGAPITDLLVRGDAVMVTTKGNEKIPGGCYYSQALFHSDGRIKGWTHWRMITGKQHPVISCWHDPNDHLISYAHDGEKSYIYNAHWRTETHINSVVEKTFNNIKGGIQGFYEGQINNNYYMIFTSDQRILLFTGKEKGYCCEKVYESSDGSLKNLKNPADAYIFSGGVIEQLGKIKTATMVHVNDQAWIVAAGQNGIAILAHADGTGFSFAEGLDQACIFKMYGNYQQVRKLIVDQGMLYILTNKQLDRIELADERWMTNARSVTIAHTNSLNKKFAFFDLLISGDFALLATHLGLLRATGSIHTVCNVQAAQWNFVDLPDIEGPITQLIALSPTDYETDIARVDNGGMIFVINNSLKYKQSRIYRLAFNPNDSSIHALHIIPDYFVHDHPTYLMNFSNRCTFATTDGAFFYGSFIHKNNTYTVKFSDVLSGRKYATFPKKQFINGPGKMTRICYSPGLKKWILLDSYHLYAYE